MSATQSQVLIVDDNPLNLQVLVDFLAGSQNFTVLMAKDSYKALNIAQKRVPDLILLDINMPGLNGYEVAKKLKANSQLKHIPIIFISALTETESKVEGFRVGGTDYITKPFQKDEVLARVEAQLRISNLQKELRENYHKLEQKNEQLKSQSIELKELNEGLEIKVNQRTEELRNSLMELERAQISLEKTNYELRDTIDQLTRTKASRKATTIILVITLLLFLVSETLENLFSFFQNNFFFLFGFKVLLVVAMKPVEMLLENYFVKNARLASLKASEKQQLAS